MQFKYLSLASVAVGLVLAADSSIDVTTTSATSTAPIASGCSFTATQTVTAAADYQKLNACNAIKGSIVFENAGLDTVIFNPQYVYGDVIVRNATLLTSFVAPNLVEITGDFVLNGLTILSNLNLAALVSVGTLSWTALPALESTGLTKAVGISKAQSVSISDTSLINLDGLNAVDVAIYDINNNNALENIDVFLQTVTDNLFVQYNSKNVEVSFPDLKWVGNLSVADVGSFEATNLQTVNGSVYFINNTFESLDLKNLTSAGAFTVSDNSDLTELNFNSLKEVTGAFVIANNSDLTTVDKFGALTTVGTLVMDGGFNNVTLPSLSAVRGTFNFASTGTADCDAFSGVTVRGKTSSSLGSDATTAKSKSSDSSSSSSKAAAAPFNADKLSVVAGVIVAGAAALF
ncbi:hypothetical protein BABINDRAFT_181292 [Babjeviella inositovora NRRL Y-12698]|uniref:Receptor L-domain domain-containing protein n=1 Tax=Babjeviella inositovora NRRL Y-12698 TaxID=984486 RepID=A0A1E3QKT3_9ASCO|nr:uncharacterized protein BABINDRAFT_181292 [Babjeviella inositovora NRRL Y-12698]ODQ78293.1 hypothetical protein BABINDRAFT_181292 [Babjeviella inositovora NRRL Y-12698]